MEKNQVDTDKNSFREAQPAMPQKSESKLRKKEDGPAPEFGKAVQTPDGTVEDVPEEAAP